MNNNFQSLFCGEVCIYHTFSSSSVNFNKLVRKAINKDFATVSHYELSIYFICRYCIFGSADYEVCGGLTYCMYLVILNYVLNNEFVHWK